MNKGWKIALLCIGAVVLGAALFVVYEWRKHTSDSHLVAVPKNATAILKINVRNLAAKADVQKLMNEPAFKKAGSDTISTVFTDPFSTGIDPVENVYGFMASEQGDLVTSVVFNIDDAKKFSDFVKRLAPDADVEFSNGCYYEKMGFNRILAWNDDAGLFLATGISNARAVADKYLHQEKDQSILSNDDYKSFSGKDFDLGLYFDNKQLAQMGGGKSMPAFGFADGHGELLVSFDDDKIAATFANYSSDASSTSVLRANGPAAKHFEAISTKAPLIYLGMATDVSKLLDLADKNPTAKMGLAMMERGIGMKESDMKKLFTGDASVAVSDFRNLAEYDPLVKSEMQNPDNNYYYVPKQPLMYISIDETDDAKANEMLANLGLSHVSRFYRMPGEKAAMYVAASNGHLLFTNDYYAADSLMQFGKLSGALPASLPKNDPFLGWVDLNQQHFPPELLSTQREESGNRSVDLTLQAMKPFREILMTAAPHGSQVNIMMEPGQGNSLYRLLSWGGNLYMQQ